MAREHGVVDLCADVDATAAVARILVYAPSSSVYGGNSKFLFWVADAVEYPVSLYAAKKRADELLFTALGAGRTCRSTSSPMRYRPGGSFHSLIGDIKRDCTYIDDIVSGTISILDNPPDAPVHRVYNLRSARSEDIRYVLSLYEKALGERPISN